MKQELWRRAGLAVPRCVGAAPEALGAFLDQTCGADYKLRQMPSPQGVRKRRQILSAQKRRIVKLHRGNLCQLVSPKTLLAK